MTSATPEHNGIRSDHTRQGHFRLPKLLKWMGGTAIGLVLFLPVAGVVITQWIDQERYKTLFISKAEEITGYKIDWDGDIRIAMLPLPHASIHQLTVKAGNAEILSVEKADIHVALTPLLSQKLEIKDITIDHPVLILQTTKSGQQTWMPKGNNPETASGKIADNTTRAEESPLDVVVKHIEINGGSFVIDNQQAGTRQEFKNLNLRVNADSLKGPFDLTGDTEWSGQKIELKATSGEINISDGSYPIQASVTLPSGGFSGSFSGVLDSTNERASGDINIELDNLSKTVKTFTNTSPSLPDGLSGKASLAAKLVYIPESVTLDEVALSVGDLKYSGSVAAKGLDQGSQPQFSFELLPQSKPSGTASALIRVLSDLTLSAKGSIENEKIQIAMATVKTMGNNVSINGYSTMGGTPTVDLVMNAPELNLDRLSEISATASGPQTKAEADSPIKTDQIGFSLPFSGRVRADIAKLTTGGKTYSNIKADITGKAGGLSISNAELSLAPDTFINVSGQIADTSKLSGVNVKLAAKTQDTEKLFQTFGVAMPELPRKIGAASINGQFSGDLQHLDFSTMISVLQFNIKGEGRVADPINTPAINSLKFNVNHPNFNEALKTVQPGFSGSTGFFGPLDLSGELAWGGLDGSDKREGKLDITSIAGKLGQTSIEGNISITPKPKTKISGALNLGAIVLPSATNNGGTVAATSASTSKHERWSSDIIDTAWMHAFDADLSIKAKSITQNMWKLTDTNLVFKLNDGTLTLDDVSAGLFGGRASINGTINAGKSIKDPLSMTAKLNAENVNAQNLMSAATGKPSYTLTGTLSKFNLDINATGASVANLVQTLSGNGALAGQNIIVKGVDAAQLATAAKGSYKPLDRAGSLFQSFQNGQTEFSEFHSDFAIQRGIVNFNKIYFDGPKATLNTIGTVNLPDWTVDLKNKMTVKETDIPPFDFTIKGSLDNPINSGGDIINQYLQKKLEKKATKLLEDKLGGKLGELLGGVSPQKESAQETTKETTGGNEGSPETSTPPPTDKEEAAKEAVKALQGLFGK